MKLKTLILSLALLAAAIGATSVEAGKNPKVTICHAAGRAGTTHYITLTIGWNAVYGPAGHFYENGTPRAGHEQDYFGPCKSSTQPSPTPTEAPSTEPTPAPSESQVDTGGSNPTPAPHFTLPPTDTE